MRISVIITTHNRGAHIRETLQSFIDIDYPKDNYEILVVDNNSTDNTKDVVGEFIHNKEGVTIRYFFEPRIGNHYGRNMAAKEARYEMLYFADDDVIADKDMLKELIRVFDFDDKVGTATGRVLPRWEVDPPRWVKQYCNNSLLSLMDPPEDFLITRNINFLYSCHQAIRKDVFFEIEGFNPETFAGVVLGDGESGVNTKIRDAGYKFGYNGKSIVHHIMPASRMTQSYLNRRMANSGSCHAYREYRRKKFSSVALIFNTMRILFVNAPIHLFKYALKTLIKRDLNLGRFFIAYTFYYRNKIRYNLWILLNQNWRKYVLKKDWLSNDTQYESEIKKYIRKS